MKPDQTEKDSRLASPPPQKLARLAGVFYLLFILAMVAANALGRSKIIVTGDALSTATNILAHGYLFRVGFVGDLLSAMLFLLAAWYLFRLLRPVNKDIAALFLVLNCCGAVIQCVSLIFLYAALPLLSGVAYLKAIPADQLMAQALFFLDIYKASFTSAQLFFGAWTFPLGYLIYKSGMLPKVLGMLMMVDCFAILFWFLQYFLFPAYPQMSYPSWAISFIAEVSLTLWLLIRGVADQNTMTKSPAEPSGEAGPASG